MGEPLGVSSNACPIQKRPALRNYVAHIDAHLWANFASDAFLLQKDVPSLRAEQEKEPLRISSANVFLAKSRAEKLARCHFVCLIALNEKFLVLYLSSASISTPPQFAEAGKCPARAVKGGGD